MANVEKLPEQQEKDNFGYVHRNRETLHNALYGKFTPRPTVNNLNNAGSQVIEERPEVASGEAHQQQGTSSKQSGEDQTTVDRQHSVVGEKPENEYNASTIVKNGVSKTSQETDDASCKKKESSSSTKVNMSGKSKEDNELEGTVTLPQTFQVKYLGHRDASGLWGIKHTRKPVDLLVSAARNTPPGSVLPIVRLVVSTEGVRIFSIEKKPEALGFYAIDTISYGVQDLVYTRVFCIIVVHEGSNVKGKHPFECHAFVCDSQHRARKLTFALSAAFKEFSQNMKQPGNMKSVKKKFAIDLRSPEEIEADLRAPEDSEA